MFGDRDKKLKIGHEKAGFLSLFILVTQNTQPTFIFFGGGDIIYKNDKSIIKVYYTKLTRHK